MNIERGLIAAILGLILIGLLAALLLSLFLCTGQRVYLILLCLLYVALGAVVQFIKARENKTCGGSIAFDPNTGKPVAYGYGDR